MISFVVPAYDEEQLIGRTLAALHAAARVVALPYEIIVVDDGLTDSTAAIARAHAATVVPVAFRQIARTRNAGARAAQGSLLVFVDADTVVPAATLRATVTAMAQGAAGGGAAVAFDGQLAPWARRLLPLLGATMRLGRLAAGCYVFCSRAAFEATGGFDERLFASEEIAFSRALRRYGPVEILREGVMTSGRKLRPETGRDALRFMARALRTGTGIVRSRDHLDSWYGQRRPDSES